MKTMQALVRVGVMVALGLMADRSAEPQSSGIPRIGIMRIATSAPDRSTDGLRAGLRDLGYVEGQTVVLEIRYSEQEERLPELAKDLVNLRVELIVAAGVPAARAVRQVNGTIPIVVVTTDPVGAGLVTDLARRPRTDETRSQANGPSP